MTMLEKPRRVRLFSPLVVHAQGGVERTLAPGEYSVSESDSHSQFFDSDILDTPLGEVAGPEFGSLLARRVAAFLSWR